MKDNWTDAERLAAEVLASGSDEAPPGWRDSGLLNSVVDAAVIFGAIAAIFIGTRPLAAPVSEARPLIAEALEGISMPSIPLAGDFETTAGIEKITAADRPVTAGDPLSLIARSLESTVGRYRSVAGMHANRKLPCSQLRQSYSEVEDTWIRYSVARGRTYGDQLPESLVRWDDALYEAVQGVDRSFTASGCSRL
jgi:hypothetical protein